MQTTAKKPGLIKRFWSILGPGLVTGASDDDLSGIATALVYSWQLTHAEQLSHKG